MLGHLAKGKKLNMAVEMSTTRRGSRRRAAACGAAPVVFHSASASGSARSVPSLYDVEYWRELAILV